MFMKSGKKKMHPIMAIGVGAMALYGAYSVVHCVKEACMEKGKMITKVFKKKASGEKCSCECGCNDECEN